MVKKLPLQNGLVALVDDEDFDKCRKHTWTVTAHGGGKSRTKYKVATTIHKGDGASEGLLLSTYVLGSDLPNSRLLYFKNGNELDFRKENLAFKESQSAKNQLKRGKANTSSKYKGVSWAKNNGKWCARIGLNGRYKNLGYFNSEDDAARAYNQKALEFYGDSAFQNIIGEDNSAESKFVERPLKPRKPKEFTSSYRGVSIDKTFNPPRYRVRVRRKLVGHFIDELEAAKAYDKEALKVFGGKAKLNFPKN